MWKIDLFSQFAFPPLLALLYPWHNNILFQGKNGMAEREMNDKHALISESFMTVSHTQNHIYIFICVPHRETITHICTTEWKGDEKRILYILTPNRNCIYQRFFCVSKEDIFRIPDLSGTDLLLCCYSEHILQTVNFASWFFFPTWWLQADNISYTFVHRERVLFC